jgi:hypothetical protein
MPPARGPVRLNKTIFISLGGLKALYRCGFLFRSPVAWNSFIARCAPIPLRALGSTYSIHSKYNN